MEDPEHRYLKLLSYVWFEGHAHGILVFVFAEVLVAVVAVA